MGLHLTKLRPCIEGQLRLDEIERFKMPLSMQEAFHAYEKDTEHITKLSFEISKLIAEKEIAYSDCEFIKNGLELFIRRTFPEKNVLRSNYSKSVSVYSDKANR